MLDDLPVLEFLRPARLKQCDQQIVGIAPDRERLPIIIADHLAGADQRFRDTGDGPPPGLGLQRIGRPLLGFVPSGGKTLILLTHLRADAKAKGTRRSRSSPRASSRGDDRDRLVCESYRRIPAGMHGGLAAVNQWFCRHILQLPCYLNAVDHR